MARRLYLLVMEAEPDAPTLFEEVEAHLMEAWLAFEIPYQLRAVRPGGILALKVLEELPPTRRGGGDRPLRMVEEDTLETEHRAGAHADLEEPLCPLCHPAGADPGLDTPPAAAVEEVLPLEL